MEGERSDRLSGERGRRTGVAEKLRGGVGIEGGRGGQSAEQSALDLAGEGEELIGRHGEACEGLGVGEKDLDVESVGGLERGRKRLVVEKGAEW